MIPINPRNRREMLTVRIYRNESNIIDFLPFLESYMIPLIYIRYIYNLYNSFLNSFVATTIGT